MPNESRIDRIEQFYEDVRRLGGQSERTAILTNVTVIDAAPAGLTGRIIIQDPKDGDYIPALTVPGIVYANNDLVNVLFVEGTEPIAYQQGSGSLGTNSFWTRSGTEISQYTDGDTVGLYDSTPTRRILVSPGAPLLPAQITIYQETGAARFIFSGGISSTTSSFSLFDASGETRFFMDSDGNLIGRDNSGNTRIDWDTGTAATDATLVLSDSGANKLELSSSDNYRISFTDGGTDVDINMYKVAVTGTPLVFWDESEDAFSQNKGLRITGGKLGVGTSDVPHGGIGSANLAIEGTNASVTDGPHIQTTTASDDRPIMQILSFTHDNWQLLIDSYYPGGASSVSSDAGSNFRFIKSGDKMHIQSDTGIAQGSAITWDDLLSFDPTNIRAGINNASPLKKLHVGPGTDTPFQTYDGLYVAINDFAQISARNNSTDVEGGFFAHTATVFMGAWTNHELRLRTNNADRITIDTSGNVGVGITSPAAKLHVDQASTTAAIPVLYLDQADISEEMIEFNTTIGVGNAIEAVGAKTLTTTHFIKVTLPGGLTRYFPVGTIA